jgi:hypothetical protein
MGRIRIFGMKETRPKRAQKRQGLYLLFDDELADGGQRGGHGLQAAAA